VGGCVDPSGEMGQIFNCDKPEEPKTSDDLVCNVDQHLVAKLKVCRLIQGDAIL
jgi:hypothetical protein